MKVRGENVAYLSWFEGVFDRDTDQRDNNLS